MTNILKQTLLPFLTFSGNAEEAMGYYVRVIGAKVESITYFEPGMPGDAGKVMNGLLDFDGAKVMFMDMAAAYPVPPFSWATSLMLNFAEEAAFDKAFAELAAEGSVMMGPEPVNDIRKVAWVTDKYGVTWQIIWV